MTKRRIVNGIPVELGSGNVYADLGYADSDAMLVKAQLAAQISDVVRRRALTQAEAAAALGLAEPRVCALLSGRFRGISKLRMIECLTRILLAPSAA